MAEALQRILQRIGKSEAVVTRIGPGLYSIDGSDPLPIAMLRDVRISVL